MQRSYLALFFFLLTTPFYLFAGEHHKISAHFKISAITNNIHLLQGKGGNIALLTGKQGNLMVDSDYQDMSDSLKIALKPYGGENKLSYIINTHWHGDHTGGNKDLHSPATIIAHDNVRKRLLTRQEIKIFNKISEPYPAHALPSLTYQKKISLHINDEHIEILHYPKGHTDGDSIVFFTTANVVHMGDHFFAGIFPFVDVGSGGNVLNMAKNIKQVLQRIDDKTKIIPGHGPLSNKQDLQNFYDMLISTSAEVATMQAKGLALSEIQKRGLSKRWKKWGNGFLNEKKWISILHSSL